MTARRGMMRSPIDRIGFGGYLSLAAKSPEFLDYVEVLANKFREFNRRSRKTSAQVAPPKVGVIHA